MKPAARDTNVAAAHANAKLAARRRSPLSDRMLLFWLKKFIAFWLMPLSFCVVGIAAGLVLMRFPKRARLGRALAISGLVALLVFSNKYTAKWLLRPLETRYAPIPELAAGTPAPATLAECRFVVVLGGGHGTTPGMAAANRLSSSSLARVTEGVRILRVLPDARLIVSGPGGPNHDTHASVLRQAALSLGVAPERILMIDQAHDTEDESRHTQRLAQGQRVALVTSAWHMPRSMALFRSAGLEAVACPTDFQTHAHDVFYFDNLLWTTAALDRSSLAFRERIGYLWIWLRGKA